MYFIKPKHFVRLHNKCIKSKIVVAILYGRSLRLRSRSNLGNIPNTRYNEWIINRKDLSDPSNRCFLSFRKDRYESRNSFIYQYRQTIAYELSALQPIKYVKCSESRYIKSTKFAHFILLNWCYENHDINLRTS